MNEGSLQERRQACAFGTVSVIGLGYIGLPTAALFAGNGARVYGMDPKREVVETVNAGRIHIVEPRLLELVKEAVGRGRLTASQEVHAADVFLLAVPTPFREGKKPDLSYVEAAAREVAPALQAGNLVILESTSPVGTTEKVRAWILAERPDLAGKLYVAHCPERVLPGRIVAELSTNDRIVGGVDAASTERAAAFYARHVKGEILRTDARTAELAKLTENSFRDVNIAFANELSLVCDRLGVDVWELIRLANRHPRVNILNPGPGVGGHCIAVDPWFIVDSAPEEARLIRTAREINDEKPYRVIEKVRESAKDLGLSRPKVACLGLSFKADIDDLRESPALFIAKELARSCAVVAVEPNILALPESLLAAGVKKAELSAALAFADIALLLVDHKAFRALDKAALAGTCVIDTRGIWS